MRRRIEIRWRRSKKARKRRKRNLEIRIN